MNEIPTVKIHTGHWVENKQSGKKEFVQTLYIASDGIKRCSQCHDGWHKRCEKHSCACLCRTAHRTHKPKIDRSLQETMERFGTIEIR